MKRFTFDCTLNEVDNVELVFDEAKQGWRWRGFTSLYDGGPVVQVSTLSVYLDQEHANNARRNAQLAFSFRPSHS